MKNVAETTSNDDFETPPRKSLKTAVQKRLPNKVDERPKKKQKENNDKGKNKGGQKQKIKQRDKIISKVRLFYTPSVIPVVYSNRLFSTEKYWCSHAQ